jgi:hypothetical protein
MSWPKRASLSSWRTETTLPAGLEHLALDAVALQRRQVFDEHLAQQVVHLVLDADGQQALGLDLARLAVARRAPDLDRAERSTPS